MKRVYSILLALCLLLTLTACGGEETPAPEPEEAGFPLPFGLSFGMTETEFAARLTEAGLTAPTVEPASSNDGYFSDSVKLPLDDPAVWDFIGSETLKKYAAAGEVDVTDPLYLDKISYDVSSPILNGSFNQNHELYEIYIGWYFTDEELALTVCEELAATYDAFFGVESTSSVWENEEYGVSFRQMDDITYMLVIHDFTHDLES